MYMYTYYIYIHTFIHTHIIKSLTVLCMYIYKYMGVGQMYSTKAPTI